MSLELEERQLEQAAVKLREDKDLPYWAVSDVIEKDIIETIEIVNENADLNERPWTEPYTLRRLYIGKNMDFTEIADLLDCHQETIRGWVEDYEVDEVGSHLRTSSKKIRKIQRKGRKNSTDTISDLEDSSMSITDIIND